MLFLEHSKIRTAGDMFKPEIAGYASQHAVKKIAYQLSVRSISGSLYGSESLLSKNVLGTTRFGRLYVSGDSYAIVWDGTIDFARLANVAVTEVGNCVRHGLGVLPITRQLVRPEFDSAHTGPPSTIEKAAVSLIVSGETDEDELVEHEFRYCDYTHLGPPAESERTWQPLRSPKRIAFARFDVTVKVGFSSVIYSFTAEKTPAVIKGATLVGVGEAEMVKALALHAKLFGTGDFAELGIRLPKSYILDKGILRWVLLRHPLSLRPISEIELNGFVNTLRTLIGFDRDWSSPSGRSGPKNLLTNLGESNIR